MRKRLHLYPLQQTVRDAVVAHGIGLHSGERVQMVLRPAPVGTGIVFRRVDRPDAAIIPARAEHVTRTLLATCLGDGEDAIQTVEHVLSAIVAMGVDNATIEVDAPEIPIFDGSAAEIVQAIRGAGLEFQPRKKTVLVATKEVRVGNDEAWIAIKPAPSLSIDFTIDFDHPVIGRQQYKYLHSPEAYEREIAHARTFGLVRDLDRLQELGLAKGGSLDNAVVVSDSDVANPDGLRYPDEFVRHKILDVIGDVALAGGMVIGEITAYRSGHELNRQLVQTLHDMQALEVRNGEDLLDEPLPQPATFATAN